MQTLEINPVIREFTREKLLKVYETMVTSRKLDEKMLTLLKQGKGAFHIGGSGHEAIQIATAMACVPGKDWFYPYYRELALTVALGVPVRHILLAHFAKSDDPFSGGRQMSEHYSSRELNIVSVSTSVATNFLPSVGTAQAMQKSKSDAVVYASVGEGSTSEGYFFEAVNWSAKDKCPNVFVIQDNKYAISVPVSEQTSGGNIAKVLSGFEEMLVEEVDGTDFFESYALMKRAYSYARSGKGPACITAHVVRLMAHSSSDDHKKYRTDEELQEDRKLDPVTKLENQLMELGYLTESAIEETKKRIQKNIDDEAAWAEKQSDPDGKTVEHFVFSPKSDKELGLEYEKNVPGGEPIVIVDAINHALAEEMERNPKVLVFGEDVAGGKGGVFTATKGLTAKFGKDRCYNSPLAEASIIGTAIGLAVAGYKPVVEIQFADYIYPAMEHLRNYVPTLRYRSNNVWTCPFVMRVPVGGYINGGLCHSQNIETFFSHIPGYKICYPSNAMDAKGLLKTAIRCDDPVLFLEHKGLYRQGFAKAPEPDKDYLIPFGKARMVREGTDATVVTWGAMVQKSVIAARQLEQQGSSLEIIDIRSIVPLDMETIFNSIRKTNRCVIIHEDVLFMGFGAEIAAQITEKAFKNLDAPVMRHGGKSTPIPFAKSLENATLPQDETVLEVIRKILEW